MNDLQWLAATVGVGALSAAVYTGWFWFLLWLAVHAVLACLAFFYALQWNLVCGKNYVSRSTPDPKVKSAVTIIIQKMMELEANRVEPPRKVVISRSIDNALQEVLDLISRHYILTWYEPLTQDKTFVKQAQAEMWSILDKVSRRLSEVDLVRFLSQDVLDCLHQHFRNIRLAKRSKETSSDKSEEEHKKFMFHSWLKDKEQELKCLREMSDALLFLLLSKSYGHCAPIRYLLREIVAGSVLKPTIDLICDPDYINQKLLSYLTYRENYFKDTKRTYTYSATYEGFVKMIKSTDSLDDLSQMRNNIISELLQASAINMLKKQQGLNTDKDTAPKGTNKGELLKARNLERYKNQLTVAKQLCEKRITSLGGTIYESSSDASNKNEDLPGQKIFSFAVIMEVPRLRECFLKFLKKEGAESYLGFWNAVEKLKSTSKEQHHHVGTEVYQQYITSSSSLVKVDKAILKGMEEFLRGDKGPDAFVTAQKQIQNLLEEQYYPSFIVSDTYFLLSSNIQDTLSSCEESVAQDELFLDSDQYSELEENLIAGQSYHAQQRLRELDVKITSKARALVAQRNSHKDIGSKLKKVHEDMEQELENLKVERRTLEMHIARTQKWIDNIGHWTAHVYDAAVSSMADSIFSYWTAHVYDAAIVTTDDGKVPHFTLLVSLSSDDQSSPHEVSSASEGWAISRTLEEIYALHDKLSLIGSWLLKKELPSTNKLFRSLDSSYIQKAKTTLDNYLAAIMKDEKMVHSEALYAFLSPTPEFVHQSVEKKSRFSLGNLLRSLPNIGSDTQEGEDDFMFSGDDNTEKDKSTDSIAKPLYTLVGEVFELQGMFLFRWFRKGLMSFVEMTFGRSIDKQLKETVEWLVSEQMLIYYIQLLKDSMWPDGKMAEPQPPQTEEQKHFNRMLAKKKLLEGMPGLDTIQTLVGDENGRRGIIKIFEALQDKNLNKHLLYNLLEIFLLELLPELRKAKEKVLLQHRVQQQEESVRLQQQLAVEEETDL
ncbi:sorting nexin-25-like [Physella acuta]|uniref:sorting nexin-25-like n=1 Tax=Physella acuta TaxID=109671 RepID=UPI0027DDB83F|nr:sorting nexin-25-like [Physella acuta]